MNSLDSTAVENVGHSKITLMGTAVAVLVCSLLISIPGTFSSGPLWPDGQRYTFNGILIHDMVRDGGVLAPYEYAKRFYAQYPATNLPYGPPFFAAIFALAFSVLGVSFWAARFVVTVYACLAGLTCWYMIYKIERNYWVSVLAASGFLLNPVVGTYARDITPEMAVAFFSFLTVYFFYGYVEFGKKYLAILAGIAFALGYLTKQYIIPLGPALLLYVFIRRKWRVLYKLESLIAAMMTLILIVPYTVLSFKYATNELGPRVQPPLDLASFLVYLQIGFSTLPVLMVLSVTGFVIGIIKKDRLTLLCLIWASCWYGFFTIFLRPNQDEKYFFSLLPAIVLPFGISCYEGSLLLKKIQLKAIAIALLGGVFVYGAVSRPVYYVWGYEDAGEYVAEEGRGRSVLYYGNYDGAFMMGVRRQIPKGGPYVLRGDRQLAVRVSYGDAKEEVIVNSSEEVLDVLNRYETGYVIVEQGMPRTKELPEYDVLLKTVKDRQVFREVARFPIKSNYRRLGPELRVYEVNYKIRGNRAEKLVIPVPTLKGELSVPFE
jgi:hypothetical protein